jgi:hypothetical protein
MDPKLPLYYIYMKGAMAHDDQDRWRGGVGLRDLYSKAGESEVHGGVFADLIRGFYGCCY